MDENQARLPVRQQPSCDPTLLRNTFLAISQQMLVAMLASATHSLYFRRKWIYAPSPHFQGRI
jgi:hypothetical protein